MTAGINCGSTDLARVMSDNAVAECLERAARRAARANGGNGGQGVPPVATITTAGPRSQIMN